MLMIGRLQICRDGNNHIKIIERHFSFYLSITFCTNLSEFPTS